MKKLLALLFSAFMLVALAGCGDNAKPQGAVTQKVMNSHEKQDFKPLTEIKEGRKNVYAVLKVMNGNYWQDVIRGLKEGGIVADVNVYIGGVMQDGDWELQRDMLNELGDKKVDAVVLAAADSTNMTASAKKLREQKRPVMLVDTALDGSDYDGAFLTNNLEAGAEVCKQMVAQLKANGVKESDDIAVLVHLSTLSSNTISERVSSIVANWNHFAPLNWKLVPEYIVNYGDEVSAVKLVEEKLKRTPNVKGIIACNNGSTNASVEAVMAAGRKDVAVTGFDLGKKTISGLESKDYSVAVAVQNQYQMGYDAVIAAAAASKGSLPAKRDVNTGIKIVDNSNYKK